MLFGRNRSTISSTIRDTPCELSCTLRKGRCELSSNFAQIRPSTIFLPSTWLPLSSLPLTTLQIAIAMSPASADGHQSRRKRILIVGAGASGMACADQLSLKPDQYEVTIIEVSLLCPFWASSEERKLTRLNVHRVRVIVEVKLSR